MSPRPARTRRPRLLPAALIASALVAAGAATALAATDSAPPPSASSCADGRQWVVVRPAASAFGLPESLLAGRSAASSGSGAGSITACVDLNRLPDTNQPTDSRG